MNFFHPEMDRAEMYLISSTGAKPSVKWPMMKRIVDNKRTYLREGEASYHWFATSEAACEYYAHAAMLYDCRLGPVPWLIMPRIVRCEWVTGEHPIRNESFLIKTHERCTHLGKHGMSRYDKYEIHRLLDTCARRLVERGDTAIALDMRKTAWWCSLENEPRDLVGFVHGDPTVENTVGDMWIDPSGPLVGSFRYQLAKARRSVIIDNNGLLHCTDLMCDDEPMNCLVLARMIGTHDGEMRYRLMELLYGVG